MLRLTFATGTEPGKWFERFRRATDHGGLETIDADDAISVLLAGDAEVALARLPLGGIDKRISEDSTHIVRLYAEDRGIAVPKDSVYAEVGEAVDPRDVADEHVNYRIADDATLDIDEIRAGLQVVAANVGIVIAPRPLLKNLSKKQVVPLELKDPTVPQTEIALVWLKTKILRQSKTLLVLPKAARKTPPATRYQRRPRVRRLKPNKPGGHSNEKVDADSGLKPFTQCSSFNRVILISLAYGGH